MCDGGAICSPPNHNVSLACSSVIMCQIDGIDTVAQLTNRNGKAATAYVAANKNFECTIFN